MIFQICSTIIVTLIIYLGGSRGVSDHCALIISSSTATQSLSVLDKEDGTIVSPTSIQREYPTFPTPPCLQDSMEPGPVPRAKAHLIWDNQSGEVSGRCACIPTVNSWQAFCLLCSVSLLRQFPRRSVWIQSQWSWGGGGLNTISACATGDDHRALF